jgi:hypothetical protein
MAPAREIILVLLGDAPRREVSILPQRPDALPSEGTVTPKEAMVARCGLIGPLAWRPALLKGLTNTNRVSAPFGIKPGDRRLVITWSQSR